MSTVSPILADGAETVTNASERRYRIHIVGGPGSGKTTLARQLATRLGVAAFELDAIAEQDGMGPDFHVRCPLAKRLADVEGIAALPEWVAEGSHLWWTDALLRAATVIVWLDLPQHVALRRILVRHVREYGHAITRERALRERLRIARRPHLRHLVEFVPYTWTYYTGAARTADVDDARSLTRAGTARYLAQYHRKVVRCAEPAQVAGLLARWTPKPEAADIFKG